MIDLQGEFLMSVMATRRGNQIVVQTGVNGTVPPKLQHVARQSIVQALNAVKCPS